MSHGRSILFLTLTFIFILSIHLHAQDSTKNFKFAGIPIINYNRTQGIVLGAFAAGYYKLNRNDTISPSSYTGIGGIYTEQKSYFLVLFQQLYFNEDRWRILAAAGLLDVNFQYYYENPSASVGNFVDYTTKSGFAVVQVQRHIIWRLYAGLSGQYIDSKTTFGLPNSAGEDSSDNNKMNNIGYVFSNDTRDEVNYPTHGIFFNYKNQFYRDWVGSDNNFTRFVLSYNQFFDLAKNEKHIIAVRANCDLASGDVPFEGQSVVGQDDIRGYSQGKYRNNQVYTLQTEYRWNFYKRFGMVGFFGLASAVENFGDIFSSQVLPGIGAGLRWRMIPSEKINIGVDGAIGRDDYSITFRIGEAFAR